MDSRVRNDDASKNSARDANLFETIVNAVATSKIAKLAVLGIGSLAASLLLRKTCDKMYRKFHKYPPGPCGLPFVGSYFALAYSRDFLIQTNSKYGSIAMCYNGFQQPTLILSNYQIIKKYFGLQSFSQRVECGMFENDNLTWKSGIDSKIRRSVLVESLISQIQSQSFLNIITNTISNEIYNNINKCIVNNIVWDVRKDVNYLTFVTIYASVIGGKLNILDKQKYNEYQLLRDGMIHFFASVNKAITITHFLYGNLPSFLKFIQDYVLNKSDCLFYQMQVKHVLRRWINRIKDTDDNSNIIVGNNKTYLSKLLKLESEGVINREELIGDLSVSFNAGNHSTAMAMEQAILFLAKYPIMQQEIYNELCLKLKLTEQELNDNDIDNKQFLKIVRQCPRLNAFIHETLRCHGFMSFLLTRVLTQETKIQDIDDDGNKREYILPKGLNIIGNIRSINDAIISKNGKDYWNFDYKNWLISSGTGDVKFNKQFNDKFVTFGSGLRGCLGEPLAKTQLYLVIAKLMLRYQFMVPINVKKDDFNIPTLYTPYTKTIGVMCKFRVNQ